MIGVWFGEDQRTNTIRHVFKRDCTTSSDFINYSTPNSEHNWEDLCIQLRNQQTSTSENHNLIKGGPIFNPIFAEAPS